MDMARGASLDLSDLELFNPDTIDDSGSQSLNATTGTLTFDLSDLTYSYNDGSGTTIAGSGLTVSTSAGTYSTFVFDDFAVGSNVDIVVESNSFLGLFGDQQQLAIVSKADINLNSDIALNSPYLNDQNGGIALVAGDSVTINATITTDGLESFGNIDGRDAGSIAIAAPNMDLENAIISAVGGDDVSDAGAGNGGSVSIYSDSPLDNLPVIETGDLDGTDGIDQDPNLVFENNPANVPDYVTSVPEPSSASLLALSLIGALCHRNRRRSSQPQDLTA